MSREAGREPIRIVELDQKRCALTYGVAPCSAALGVTGPYRCYNTFGTCQVPTDFELDAAPLTLRFVEPHAAVPRDEYLLPFLQDVKVSPGRLNVGGRSDRDGPLGHRASVTVTLQDAPHSDNMVDPYLAQRSWDGLERGTFWSKWLARVPHHTGLALRVREGYAGQALEDMRVLHFVVDQITGPDSSGRVTIKGLDILRLADDKRAQAPSPSRGILGTNLTATYAAELWITGAYVEDYPAPGMVKIDDEFIGYTTSDPAPAGYGYPEDSVRLTGLTRGELGTTDAGHAQGATVQAVLEYTDVDVHLVVHDLLTRFARLPASYLPLADWAAEVAAYLPHARASRLLFEPTGVLTLLGELAEQFGCYLWWDPEAQEVRLRAIDRNEDPALLLTEDRDILQGSLGIKGQPEERATEVWVYHSLRDGQDPSERSSYDQVHAEIDPTASAPYAYGDRRVYEILASWVTSPDHAADLAAAVLGRLRDVPYYVTLQLDGGRDDVAPARLVDLRHRAFVAPTGEMADRRYQLISVHLTGDRIACEARPYQG